MKILLISNNPSRASYRQRIGIHLELLASNGINCKLTKLPKVAWKRWKIFKSAKDYDAVFLHKKCLNFFDAVILRKYAKKIVYDFDDAVMYSPNYPQRYSISHQMPFKRTIEIADLVIAGNSYLANEACKYRSDVYILPTGLDTSEYIKTFTKKDTNQRLVWIGSKNTLHYLEQAIQELEALGRKFKNLILRIICDDFFELEDIKVEKNYWSKETQAKDLIECDIGISYLPDDNFTKGKCGFKILQYYAAGLPVIASPVGMNADILTEGKNGFFASTKQEWVEKISRLLLDKELRNSIGKNNLEYVKNFDSKVIGNRLVNLLSSNIAPASYLKTFKPMVSVCIPTYNRKDYLKQTIDSVLGQSYRNFEIIVVDDGSTDGTQEMIKQYDFPITYFWQKNKGDAAARNKLIELAKGDYISFLDSDDMLLLDSLERLVAVAACQPNTIAYGSYYRVDETGRIYGKCRRKLYSGRITEKLFETILVHSCGSLFPKNVLTEGDGFDTDLKNSSDYKKWLNLSTKYNFIAVEKPTFKRRRHLGNISQPRLEVCKTEYRVLLDFYNSNKELISNKIVKLTLAKSARRCARHALNERKYSESIKFSKISLNHKIKIKTLFYFAIAHFAYYITTFSKK